MPGRCGVNTSPGLTGEGLRITCPGGGGHILPPAISAARNAASFWAELRQHEGRISAGQPDKLIGLESVEIDQTRLEKGALGGERCKRRSEKQVLPSAVTRLGRAQGCKTSSGH